MTLTTTTAVPTAPAAARPPTPPRRKPADGPAARALGLVGSYAMAIALLLVLMVIVGYGTMAQRWMSLYDVQRTYFSAWFTILDFGSVPVPFPGGLLALSLLCANLVVGGVIRIRKGTSTLGILVAHIGILVLFGGSLVESMFADKGHLTVYEGEGRSEFQSYDDWEIVIRERHAGDAVTEWILPSGRLTGLSPRDVARFEHDRLPFVAVVSGWQRNAEPRPASRGTPRDATADGWTLAALDPIGTGDGTNLPGCWLTLAPRGAPAAAPRSILWGGASLLDASGNGLPWVATVAGRQFEADLRTKRWALPFRLTLNRFVHTEHPGTRMDREFSSYVTKLEDGAEREIHITMNEPLRHRGYIIYQSGWGPLNARPGQPLFSTFAVVFNPSDQVPLIACIVIAAGLLFHFGLKLNRHLRSESRRVPKTSGSPS